MFLDTPRGRLTRIGAWELGPTLGRGAYAHVRLATHLVTGHKAACKILPSLHSEPGPVGTNATLDAIEAHKEVVLLKALVGAKIPGIVGLQGVIEDGGWTYVFLDRHKKCLSSCAMLLDERMCKDVMRHLLRTMEVLHEIGLSHEDLKRANILLTFGKQGFAPVLVDFGFSNFFPEGGMVQSQGGTLEYSSPEKVADLSYDPRAADVWSLGIVFARMLGMGNPYVVSGVDGNDEIRWRILHEKPDFQWRLADLVPGGRAELLKSMLQCDPRKRPTVSQVLNHPYLQCNTRDAPIRVPPVRLRRSVPRPVSPAILQDIMFLSFLKKSLFLCETPQKIEERLYSDGKCWEQRWASMLAGWECRAECEWEDLPDLPAASKGGPLSHSSRIPRLREINMSPLVVKKPASITTHVPSDPDATPKPTGRKPLTKGNSNQIKPKPKVLAMSRTITAAVGSDVKPVMGPNAFGAQKQKASKVPKAKPAGTKSAGKAPSGDENEDPNGLRRSKRGKPPRGNENEEPNGLRRSKRGKTVAAQTSRGTKNADDPAATEDPDRTPQLPRRMVTRSRTRATIASTSTTKAKAKAKPQLSSSDNTTEAKLQRLALDNTEPAARRTQAAY